MESDDNHRGTGHTNSGADERRWIHPIGAGVFGVHAGPEIL